MEKEKKKRNKNFFVTHYLQMTWLDKKLFEAVEDFYSKTLNLISFTWWFEVSLANRTQI